MKTRFLISMLIILAISACGNKQKQMQEKQVQLLETEEKKEIFEKVMFKAGDGLEVTGNLYHKADDAPTIVLCHQARFNKAEYAGIAEELMKLGYNCLAIDQRSGGPIAHYQNETNMAAKAAGKGVDYLDAKQDIEAAVSFAKEKYGKPVIVWGSSYSSTLVLYVAAENENVSAVLSFSPGNYFVEELGDLNAIMADFQKPMFLTSSNPEAQQVTDIIKGKELGENQVQFIPEGNGHHGSRALWPNQDGGEEYWTAVKDFLSKLK